MYDSDNSCYSDDDEDDDDDDESVDEILQRMAQSYRKKSESKKPSEKGIWNSYSTLTGSMHMNRYLC